MEWIPEQSKPGHYDSYIDESGEKYVVINRLSEELLHEPTALEQFLITNYSTFEFAYWCLAVLTFGFLLMKFILIPLYKQRSK